MKNPFESQPTPEQKTPDQLMKENNKDLAELARARAIWHDVSERLFPAGERDALMGNAKAKFLEGKATQAMEEFDKAEKELFALRGLIEQAMKDQKSKAA